MTNLNSSSLDSSALNSSALNSSANDYRPAAAIAILYQDNRFLLQLRDDKPQIRYPGCWAFFGGHIDPGEQPADAMRRELQEEIGYRPSEIHYLGAYMSDQQIIRHVFYAALTVGVESLQLNEGQDLKLCTIEAVHQGSLVSDRLGEPRPMAAPHRQILLDFLQTHPDHLSLPQPS